MVWAVEETMVGRVEPGAVLVLRQELLGDAVSSGALWRGLGSVGVSTSIFMYLLHLFLQGGRKAPWEVAPCQSQLLPSISPSQCHHKGHPCFSRAKEKGIQLTLVIMGVIKNNSPLMSPAPIFAADLTLCKLFVNCSHC